MKLAVVMVSCAARAAVRAQTLASLAASDFDGAVDVVLDDEALDQPLARVDATWVRALQRASDERVASHVLLVEDDVVVNKFLRHNLERWSPLQGKGAADPLWASLYYPSSPHFRARIESPPGADYRVVSATDFWSAQGILISPALAGWVLNFWPGPVGPHDRVVPWLASHMCERLYLHKPSLVEHIGHRSTIGSIPHQAVDFDLNWRASR